MVAAVDVTTGICELPLVPFAAVHCIGLLLPPDEVTADTVEATVPAGPGVLGCCSDMVISMEKRTRGHGSMEYKC